MNPPTPTPKKLTTGRPPSFEPLPAKAFGLTIRGLREERGIAQDAFALLAKVDRSYYGKLERGERQPTLGLMLRIATALGVPASELVAQTEMRLKAL